MEFDTRLRNKLIGTLRSELPKIELRDSGGMDIESVIALDKVFTGVLMNAPKTVKAEISDYVGENPFIAVMWGVLHDELASLAPADKAGKSRLCELSPFSDVEALAIRLVALLEALPNHYVAVMELPTSLSEEMYKSNAPPILGQNIALIGVWHGKQNGYPVPPLEVPLNLPQNMLEGLLSSMSPLNQTAENAQSNVPRSHLYVKFDGLFKAGYCSHPFARFTTVLKAFFGIAIGMEVLESGWSNQLYGIGNIAVNVYQDGLDGFHQVEGRMVGANDSALIDRIRVHDRGHVRLMQDLNTIVRVLDVDNSFPQLVLAGRWLFDSYSNSDSVMGFMQLAICAEVLLGTEDGGEGVTAMLATRCAYLIATNAIERETLMKEFKGIYQVRSKIVHRGLGTLNRSEYFQFRRLKTIVNRVLHKEIQLALMNDLVH